MLITSTQFNVCVTNCYASTRGVSESDMDSGIALIEIHHKQWDDFFID